MRKLIPPAPLFCIAAILLVLGDNLAQAQSDTCVSPINDINYTRYTIAEGAVYTETNSGPVMLESSNAYLFEATVALKTNFTATSAQLIITNGAIVKMAGAQRNFSYEAATNSFAGITSAFPGGTYQFIVSNDVTTLTFPDNVELPNAPTLADYTAAQIIDPTKDFTLKWNPFTNGTAKDLMDLNIASAFGSFKAPDYGCPGQLTGKSTSIVIPANTLTSNTTYRGTITFVNILMVDTNSTPFVALLAGTEVQTIFNIATVGANATPLGPVVANVAALANGSVRFDVSVIPSTNYLVQSSPKLTTPTWTTLLTTNASGNEISFTNKPSGNELFYRVLPQ